MEARSFAVGDEFARAASCVLGVPVDDLDMDGLVHRIGLAAATRQPLFLSTTNLNFLVQSAADPAFRYSLLERAFSRAGYP